MKKQFKILLNAVIDAKNEEEISSACGKIDSAFNHDKITWEEHETLYKLVDRLTGTF